MDFDPKTPSAENLRQMPYTELRKVAAKFGIQRMMKAEKLIAAILSKYSDDDESFSTPAVKELNSSRKNKEKKFDELHMTPLVTPRRGTYSVESPLSLKMEDLSSVSLEVNTSVLDVSNVTVSRGSERKLRPRKVSFMSPVMTPRTPKSHSLRNRPKTPVASRTPLNESVTSVSFSGRRKRKSLEESSTPQSKIVKFETDSAVKSSIVPETTSLPSSTPKVPKKDEKPKNVKSSATKSVVTKDPTSLKKGTTPNFKRIHQKAFEKMESIDDYQKRKLLNSAKKIDQHPTLKSMTKAKSKVSAFSGIPFIPSVRNKCMELKVKNFVRSVDKATNKNSPQTSKSRFDFKAKNLLKKDTPQPVKSKFDSKMSKRENNSVKSKFDLKASLSRKLSYKPYRGPLKPLSESNKNSSVVATDEPEPVVNKVLKENRCQTRSIIKGVRTNKRFALQMKNRKLD